MPFDEVKQLLINRFGVEPDLDDDMYIQLAEEYNIEINNLDDLED